MEEETKRNKIKEETKKEVKEEIPSQLTEGKSMVKEYAQEMRVKPDITSYIKRDGMGSVSISPTFNFSNMNNAILKEQYFALLKNKTVKDLPEIFDAIFNSRKALQNRIFCEIALYSQGKVVAMLKATTILIEHRIHIISFWLGKEIDLSSFSRLVSSFEARMHKFGVNSVLVMQEPMKTEKGKAFTIDNVGTTFTFA